MNNKPKFLVLGEQCKDVYLYTSHTRQSPEDPSVPVFKVQERQEKDGMTANVINNVKALGAEVYSLESGGSITKTRVIVDGKQKCRIDLDSPATDLSEEEIISNLQHHTHLVDAVIVEDYGKGFFTNDIYKKIFELYPKTFVDTSPFVDFSNYKNCYLLKPNLIEAENATGEKELSKIFAKLFNITNAQYIVITSGADGMYAMEKSSTIVWHWPALSLHAKDVTGCGDTCIAALAYAIMKGDDLFTAMKFASKAAAICVEHDGVYAPSLREIEAYKSTILFE